MGTAVEQYETADRRYATSIHDSNSNFKFKLLSPGGLKCWV